MKKIVSIMLTVMIIFTAMVSMSVSAATYDETVYKSGEFEYIIFNSEVYLTGYTGSSKSLEIPASLDGHKVMYIGKPKIFDPYGYYRLAGAESIESLVVGNNVKGVMNGVFSGFENLKSVNFKSGVENIERAFSDCIKLKEITMPSTVVEIDAYAFNKTEWYKSQPDGEVYLGDVLLTYKGEMPDNYTLNVKNGTRIIAENAFSGKEGLADINVPSSVEYIGERAFEGTKWLNSQNDGMIYLGNVAYIYKGNIPKNIKIKPGTTGISGRAFFDNNPFYYESTSSGNLKNIIIPDSVKYIGRVAFGNCCNLESILIPKSVAYLGEGFYGFGAAGKSVYPKMIWGDYSFNLLGYSNTVAEKYAKDNEFKFIALDEQMDFSSFDPKKFLGMTLDEITGIFGDDFEDIEELESGRTRFIGYPNTGNPFEFGFADDTKLVKYVYVYDLTAAPIKLFDDITNKSTLNDMENSKTSFTYTKWVGMNALDDNNTEQIVTYKLNGDVLVSFNWTFNDFNNDCANRVLITGTSYVEDTTKETQPESTNKPTINPTVSTDATSKVSTTDTATKDTAKNDNGIIQTGAVSLAVIVLVLLVSFATGAFVIRRRKIK